MLEVTNLYKHFQGHDNQLVRAVDGASISVAEGELFTLLGPSGCGKTTTLRCIAGLERAQGGEIRIGDEIVFSEEKRTHVAVHDRDVGMVFQSYAIWPHMNVFKNVAFPLRVARPRPPKAEIERRVMASLARVQLDHLAGRDATKLSGGQQQRLALARALVREPKLLLLDEPLSNLDAKLREQMRFELKKLQRELGITSLYVTHDQFEALALSNFIAVMRDGQIMQIGTPREIYEEPANQFVASFIGSTNFIPGEIVSAAAGGGEGYQVKTSLGTIRCGAGQPGDGAKDVLVAVRPENIFISAEAPDGGDDGENVFEGEVVNWVYLGECNDIEVRIEDKTIRARAHPDMNFARHSKVWVELSAPHCVVLPSEEEPAAN